MHGSAITRTNSRLDCEPKVSRSPADSPTLKRVVVIGPKPDITEHDTPASEGELTMYEKEQLLFNVILATSGTATSFHHAGKTKSKER